MNPSRFWLDREITAFAQSLPPDSLVLDAGSGRQPYRPKFSGHRYESADFEMVDKSYAPSTYVCDLSAIPVEDNRYDAVLFSQVMEHLPNPAAVLHELNRVLKPGGMLFCSAPFFYQEHEQPYDFYRYTQFGFRHLLESNNFDIEQLRWLEGFMGTVYWQLRWTAKYMPMTPKSLGGGLMGWLLVPPVVIMKGGLRLIAGLARRCDRRFRYTGRGYPTNYLAIARKRPPLD